MQSRKIIEHIVKWLKDYAGKSPGIKGFTVGISNGIDSSVVSTLCARTGLPLLALQLPIDLTKKKEKKESIHGEWLKNQYGSDQIRTITVNLTDAYDQLKTTVTQHQSNEKSELALANVQSRLRMVKLIFNFSLTFEHTFFFSSQVTLYYLAQVNGHLVVGTGNKVEDFGVGFFTKYGKFFFFSIE